MAISKSTVAVDIYRTPSSHVDAILESFDVSWEYYAHTMRDRGFVSFIIKTSIPNMLDWCQEHLHADDFYYRANSYVVWIKGRENIAEFYLTFSDSVKMYNGC